MDGNSPINILAALILIVLAFPVVLYASVALTNGLGMWAVGLTVAAGFIVRAVWSGK